MLPALLCHKAKAKARNAPRRGKSYGAFHAKAPIGGFRCLELVLYGLRVLVEQHYDQDPTNQSKTLLALDQ